MKARIVYSALLIGLLGAPVAPAQQGTPSEDEVQKALSKLAALGPGVVKYHTDDKGRITDCVVVAKARISTVLGKAKGLETARERAGLAAAAEFVRWLKQKVSVHAKSEDEVVIFMEGSEGNDQDVLRESGKAVEKTSKQMESIAEGLVRGLQVLHTEISDKDKTYTVVMGWDAATAIATKGVKALNESDSDAGTTTATDPGKKEAQRKKIDKKLEDQKATSPDAGKFVR